MQNFELVKKLKQRNEQILALGYMSSLHEDLNQLDEAIQCYKQVRSNSGVL